jgi:CheY-like chemotaxis protein
MAENQRNHLSQIFSNVGFHMLMKRVLVIDDEKAIQEVIQVCLEELGEWEVLTASSGREGLYVAESKLPDGILLDVSMPDMDGFETLQKLQENSVTQGIPVALLTAGAQLVDIAQYHKLGIAGVINKPFNPLMLINQIAEVFHWE